MDIYSLENKWNNDFQETCKNVKSLLTYYENDDKYTKSFKNLAQWLVLNDSISFDSVPKHFKNYTSTSFELEYFLSLIHHAICDDGLISFVTMYYEEEIQRIFLIFNHEVENNFVSDCLLDCEEFINRFYSTEEFKKQNITKQDIINSISFTSHTNPELFIQEVEKFTLFKKEQKRLLKEWINSLED